MSWSPRYNSWSTQEPSTEQFAVPAFRLPPEADGQAAGLVSVTTTAARGRLNCTFLDVRCAQTTRPGPPAPPGLAALNVSCNEWTATIPENLYVRNGCVFSNLPSKPWSPLCWSPKVAITDDTAASWNLRDTGAFLMPNRTALRGRILTSRSDEDCPALLHFGEEVVGDCAASRMSLALCNPYLEVTEAQETLELPSLAIRGVNSAAAPSSPPDNRHMYGLNHWLEYWQYYPFSGTSGYTSYGTDNRLNSAVFRVVTSEGNAKPSYLERPVSR